MKHNLLFAFLFLSLIINAQSNYQRKLFQSAGTGTVGEVVYSNEYNTSTFVVRKMTATPYAVYGEIIKFTTSTGNVTSSKTFSVTGYDLTIINVVKNNQMLYMAAIVSNSVGMSPCIIKYNLSTNATVWRKTLSSGSNIFSRIVYDNAKNIYLLGSYYNPTQSKTDLLLAKMDTNGVLFWTKNIGETTFNQNQNPGGIAFNGNRALYISNSASNAVSNSSVLRLDSAGTILSSKTITVNVYPKFFQNYLAILNGNLLSIDRTDSISIEGPVLLRMLDTNLTATITKTLSPGLALQNVFSNNTNLLLSGPAIGQGLNGIRTIRFDSLLNVLGSRHFNKSNSSGPSNCGFINSSNASFHFFNPNFSDTVFVLKTDAYEKVSCNDSIYNVASTLFNYTNTALNYTTGAISFSATTITIPVSSVTYSSTSLCTSVTTGINSLSNNEAFSIYPNPVNSVLNFDLETTAVINFKITDVTGKELISGSGQTTVDVSDLKTGIYFLSVSDQNKQLLGIKKFIKD